jgi:hypothetical protein
MEGKKKWRKEIRRKKGRMKMSKGVKFRRKKKEERKIERKKKEEKSATCQY